MVDSGWAQRLKRQGVELQGSKGPTLIVADRWIYNYLGQPYSVAYSGPRPLAKLAARLAPRPNMIAILIAPGSVVAQRKQELTAEQADEETERWMAISGSWWRARVFDTTRPAAEVAADIMKAVMLHESGVR